MIGSILSAAAAGLPTVTASCVASASYDVYKHQRVLSCYNKIVREADRLLKDGHYSSPLIPVADLCRSRLSRLDYKILIPPSLLEVWFKEVRDRAAFDLFTGYEWPVLPARPDVIFRNAAERGIRARAEGLVFRISEALDAPGYPVFWTLTVDPRHDGVIGKGRREFELWLRKVRKAFGDFRYCCVTERGDEGRLHMHSLFIFDELRFSDPNYWSPGRLAEVPEMRSFWPYGFSNPVPVRYGPTDHYGAAGWKWPLGMESGSPAAVARYMAGYITQPSKEIDGCRSKMTRGLGLNRLRAEMTLPEAMLILAGDPLPLLNRLSFREKPPVSILRHCAAKKIFGVAIPPSLPTTRTGSVRESSKLLAMEKSIRTKTGDSLNRVAGFEWQLDQFRQLTSKLRIGLI